MSIASNGARPAPRRPLRVMMTTFAANTHFQPLVPLAWALRTAGHEVRLVSQPSLSDVVTQAGLTSVPVGTEAPVEQFAATWGGDAYIGVNSIDFTGDDPGLWTWPYLLGMETMLVPAFYELLNNESFVDGVVEFARDWRPDLVIWEPLTFAGAVAARVTGAAHARLPWGQEITLRGRQAFLAERALQPFEHREDPTAEWLGRMLDRYGCSFDEEMVTGQWTIDTLPRSMRLELSEELRTLDMRYVPYNGPAVVPPWVWEPCERPRVCLTIGTSQRDSGRHHVPLDHLLDSLADVDAEIVATLDTTQQEHLRGAAPGNVRLVDFVPLHALMPTCSAIVHHGGPGTWSTAALHGVPQIILDTSWDTPVRAQRMQRLGAGLSMPVEELGVEALRDRVLRLLGEPEFRAGAERIRAEMLAMPAPGDVVPDLERLTAEHATGAVAGRR